MPASWQVSGFFGEPVLRALHALLPPSRSSPPPAGHYSRELYRRGNTGGARGTMHCYSLRITYHRFLIIYDAQLFRNRNSYSMCFVRARNEVVGCCLCLHPPPLLVRPWVIMHGRSIAKQESPSRLAGCLSDLDNGTGNADKVGVRTGRNSGGNMMLVVVL